MAFTDTTNPELAHGVKQISANGDSIKPLLPKPLAIGSEGLVNGKGSDDIHADVAQVNRRG